MLAKLKALGINIEIVKVIESILTNRSQKVVVEGQLSEPAYVPSGVPQGSVLGPTLFLIFINDICKDLSSNIRLFADDCCLYRKIKSELDRILLQKDLNKIMAWCKRWGMELNLGKCVFMTVSRLLNKIVRSYELGGVKLEKVTAYKYLGVTLCSNLTWHNHVNQAITKANQTLGFVRKNLKNALSRQS